MSVPDKAMKLKDGKILYDDLRNRVSNLLSALNQKQTAPSSPGTAGQVLGLDANLDPAWVDQTGGGGQTDIGLSVVNGMICVTYEEAV